MCLRKSRFFLEFATAGSSLTLGKRIVEGELSGGTDAVKCRALAWCARLLSRTEELGKASGYLTLAKGLGTRPEIDIADAFIASQNGNKGTALKTLAGIDSPASRSAALMIVAHHEGAEGALDWLKDAAIEAADFDPEGKYFLLTSQLKLEHWDAGRDILVVLTQHDYREASVLHHVAANNTVNDCRSGRTPRCRAQALAVCGSRFPACIRRVSDGRAAEKPNATLPTLQWQHMR